MGGAPGNEPGSAAPVAPQPADPWRRLMCIAYEGVILFGVVFFFGYGFSALTQFKGAPGTLRWAFQAFMFCVLAVYFTWFWSEGRRTLPMKTMGVRLVGPGDAAPGRARAFARFTVAGGMLALAIGAAYVVHPALALLALVPFSWALFDRQRRALYDLVCGTRLVRDAPPARAAT
jgi:uncharacterized RDD family membrane protein YckC